MLEDSERTEAAAPPMSDFARAAASAPIKLSELDVYYHWCSERGLLIDRRNEVFPSDRTDKLASDA